MDKKSVILLLMLTLILAACSSTPNTAAFGPNPPGGGAAGQLSTPIRVALGTIKLEGTENTVTPEQAKTLLPLWETLRILEGSDTAASEEKDALVSQIQETMTPEQTQAITALDLSRQDMISAMQSQAQTLAGSQNNGSTARSGNGGGNSGGNGFFIGGGGPPPDGGFAGGNPNFQGQGQRAQAGNSTDNNNQPAAVNPSRIPTPLIQAVIEYLKTKAGA